MLVVTRIARHTFLVISCLALVGCSGSADTTPEADIPNIPPAATRSMPGDTGGNGNEAIPAQPPR